MIAGIEQLVFFEDLQKSQKRIYNDACDVGVQLTPDLSAQVREHLEELAKMYQHRFAGSAFTDTASADVWLTFEADGELYHGVHLHVCRFGVKSRPYTIVPAGQYVSVDISPWSDRKDSFLHVA